MHGAVTPIHDAARRGALLAALRRSPAPFAWAIQDLEKWPESTRAFILGGPRATPVEDPADFLLISGHPACRRSPTVIIGGGLAAARRLVAACMPPAPWLVRETPATVLPALTEHASEAVVYFERRMEVSRAGFTPAPVPEGVTIRRLAPPDAPRLAEFYGKDPKAAVTEYLSWIMGSLLLGAFIGDELAATACSLAQTDLVWEIGAVQASPRFRRRGCGSAVTSAVTAAALEAAGTASLTVRQGNATAIGVYQRLGYVAMEERIWVDNGCRVAP